MLENDCLLCFISFKLKDISGDLDEQFLYSERHSISRFW